MEPTVTYNIGQNIWATAARCCTTATASKQEMSQPVESDGDDGTKLWAQEMLEDDGGLFGDFLDEAWVQQQLMAIIQGEVGKEIRPWM